MTRPVTIINIRSLSYTGTTWINLLLGCHERAFALGPPDRVVNLLRESPEDSAKACRVHEEGCSFWPRFFEIYRPEENFYVQLARASGREVIIINNPVFGGVAAQQMHHPDILVRDLAVVRDGRAVVASYLRYYPDSDFTDAVRGWFLPSAGEFAFDEQDPDALCVRYEDVAADPLAFLRRVRDRFDLTYDDRAVRYWEFEHHPAAGNAGTIDIIRRAHGRRFRGEDHVFREARYQQIIADPAHPPLDTRWQSELDERARLIFDSYCGAINASWGYERDRFSADAVRAFDRDLAAAGESPPHVIEARPIARRAKSIAKIVSRSFGSASRSRAKKLSLVVGGMVLLGLAVAAIAAVA